MVSLRQTSYIFIILIFLSGCSRISQDKLLHSIFESEWNYFLEQNPVYATSLGHKGLESRWRDLSFKSFEVRKNHAQELLLQLDKVDQHQLSKTNQLNFRLFKKMTQEDFIIEEFNHHLLPFSHRGGIQLAHEEAESLILITSEDYRHWLSRLDNLDTRIMQTISLAREGLKQGYLAPKVLMFRVQRQIKLQIDNSIEKNPFYKVFSELPTSISMKEKQEIQFNAKEIIFNKLVPAYKELDKFFSEIYLPASRASFGIYDTPRGKKFYETAVRFFTTTDLTPEEIHQIGLEEVKRIKSDMYKVMRELSFSGSFKDFLNFLRTDERFYYQSSDELFEGYLSITKKIDPELVKLFRTLPRTPYGLRPIPIESAPDTTTAYYMPPSPGGLRPGYYYVNLYRPETRPKYEMEVLSVHEAVPGHHLQISLALEKKDMPMFRRISPYTVFVEGWGLYSEGLGYEIGLYKDHYSKFGQLTYDMWRAVRLVVDTGIHYFGWDRQRAIDFFMDNAGKSELDIVNEIDRYINWPGQALAYKIGQMKLLELKKKAKEQLGTKFDIRDFHDTVLREGALPLNELEILVDTYILDNK